MATMASGSCDRTHVNVSENKETPFNEELNQFGSIVLLDVKDKTVKATFPLGTKHCSFGRYDWCDVRIHKPQVSKLHAQIDVDQTASNSHRTEASFTVHSKHGVIMNNITKETTRKLYKEDMVPLEPGILINIAGKLFAWCDADTSLEIGDSILSKAHTQPKGDRENGVTRTSLRKFSSSELEAPLTPPTLKSRPVRSSLLQAVQLGPSASPTKKPMSASAANTGPGAETLEREENDDDGDVVKLEEIRNEQDDSSNDSLAKKHGSAVLQTPKSCSRLNSHKRSIFGQNAPKTEGQAFRRRPNSIMQMTIIPSEDLHGWRDDLSQQASSSIKHSTNPPTPLHMLPTPPMNKLTYIDDSSSGDEDENEDEDKGQDEGAYEPDEIWTNPYSTQEKSESNILPSFDDAIASATRNSDHSNVTQRRKRFSLPSLDKADDDQVDEDHEAEQEQDDEEETSDEEVEALLVSPNSSSASLNQKATSEPHEVSSPPTVFLKKPVDHLKRPTSPTPGSPSPSWRSSRIFGGYFDRCRDYQIPLESPLKSISQLKNYLVPSTSSPSANKPPADDEPVDPRYEDVGNSKEDESLGNSKSSTSLSVKRRNSVPLPDPPSRLAPLTRRHSLRERVLIRSAVKAFHKSASTSDLSSMQNQEHKQSLKKDNKIQEADNKTAIIQQVKDTRDDTIPSSNTSSPGPQLPDDHSKETLQPEGSKNNNEDESASERFRDADVPDPDDAANNEGSSSVPSSGDDLTPVVTRHRRGHSLSSAQDLATHNILRPRPSSIADTKIESACGKGKVGNSPNQPTRTSPRENVIAVHYTPKRNTGNTENIFPPSINSSTENHKRESLALQAQQKETEEDQPIKEIESQLKTPVQQKKVLGPMTHNIDRRRSIMKEPSVGFQSERKPNTEKRKVHFLTGEKNDPFGNDNSGPELVTPTKKARLENGAKAAKSNQVEPNVTSTPDKAVKTTPDKKSPPRTPRSARKPNTTPRSAGRVRTKTPTKAVQEAYNQYVQNKATSQPDYTPKPQPSPGRALKSASSPSKNTTTAAVNASSRRAGRSGEIPEDSKQLDQQSLVVFNVPDKESDSKTREKRSSLQVLLQSPVRKLGESGDSNVQRSTSPEKQSFPLEDHGFATPKGLNSDENKHPESIFGSTALLRMKLDEAGKQNSSKKGENVMEGFDDAIIGNEETVTPSYQGLRRLFDEGKVDDTQQSGSPVSFSPQLRDIRVLYQHSSANAPQGPQTPALKGLRDLFSENNNGSTKMNLATPTMDGIDKLFIDAEIAEHAGNDAKEGVTTRHQASRKDEEHTKSSPRVQIMIKREEDEKDNHSNHVDSKSSSKTPKHSAARSTRRVVPLPSRTSSRIRGNSSTGMTVNNQKPKEDVKSHNHESTRPSSRTSGTKTSSNSQSMLPRSKTTTAARRNASATSSNTNKEEKSGSSTVTTRPGSAASGSVKQTVPKSNSTSFFDHQNVDVRRSARVLTGKNAATTAKPRESAKKEDDKSDESEDDFDSPPHAAQEDEIVRKESDDVRLRDPRRPPSIQKNAPKSGSTSNRVAPTRASPEKSENSNSSTSNNRSLSATGIPTTSRYNNQTTRSTSSATLANAKSTSSSSLPTKSTTSSTATAKRQSTKSTTSSTATAKRQGSSNTNTATTEKENAGPGPKPLAKPNRSSSSNTNKTTTTNSNSKGGVSNNSAVVGTKLASIARKGETQDDDDGKIDETFAKSKSNKNTRKNDGKSDRAAERRTLRARQC